MLRGIILCLCLCLCLCHCLCLCLCLCHSLSHTLTLTLSQWGWSAEGMYAERICHSAITPQWPFVLLARLMLVRLLSRESTGGGCRPSAASPHRHGGMPMT